MKPTFASWILSLAATLLMLASPGCSTHRGDAARFRGQEAVGRSQHDREYGALASPWERQRAEQEHQWHSEAAAR